MAAKLGQLAEKAKFFCVLFASPFNLDTWPHFSGYVLHSSVILHPYHAIPSPSGKNPGLDSTLCHSWGATVHHIPKSRMIRGWPSGCIGWIKGTLDKSPNVLISHLAAWSRVRMSNFLESFANIPVCRCSDRTSVKYSASPQTPGIRVFIKHKNRGNMNSKLQGVDTVLLKLFFPENL